MYDKTKSVIRICCYLNRNKPTINSNIRVIIKFQFSCLGSSCLQTNSQKGYKFLTLPSICWRKSNKARDTLETLGAQDTQTTAK